MQLFSLSPLEIPANFWPDRFLSKKSVQREAMRCYSGSRPGFAWFQNTRKGFADVL